MKKQEKDFYRVVAATKCRDAYPVYKYYNDPEEWSCNGTVIVSCKDGNVDVKIYGIAKGSGMIFPNMATTLGYIFTDASLSSSILQKLLRKNM